jgi:hypothetical protein
MSLKLNVSISACVIALILSAMAPFARTDLHQ